MTVTERIFDLSTCWKGACQAFAHFDKTDFSWDEKYREFLPKVMAAETDREHFLLLSEFLNLLGDGHTDIQLPKALRDELGYLPFSLQYIGGRYYADLQEVLSINGIPMEELLQTLFRYAYHVGDYIYPTVIEKFLPFFLKPTENRLLTEMGERNFDLLPESPKDGKGESLQLREFGDILYIRIDDFLQPDYAEKIREKLSGKDSVILDVRENMGGMTLYGARVAELFISGEFHGCQKKTQKISGVDLASASQIARMSEASIARFIRSGLCREEDAAWSRKAWNHQQYEYYTDSFGSAEHKAVFDGKCVLLTSRNTISAAEDFVAMFRSSGRAKIIGTSTCGTTGTPLILSLSSGSARICSVGYRLLDDTEFIGIGIQPDVVIEPSAPDLRSGNDPVLQYALDFLKV